MATIITIITIHRTDLGVSGVDITTTEWERCTDLIEAEMDKAGIDWQTASFTIDRWNLRIENDSDVDPAKSIIDRAIEGSFGQWTDAANDA